MRCSNLVILAAALAACNGSNDSGDVSDVADTDTDTGAPYVTPPDPPTWQVTAQDGSIVAVHTRPGAGLDETFAVQAVFSKTLQGFPTAAGCMIEGGICIESLPARTDQFVDTETPFDRDRNYTWNGFSLSVDTIVAPFVNELPEHVQYYEFTLEGPPLDDHPVISFSGEWGTYSAAPVFIPAMELLEPAGDDNIDVTDGFGTIRWTPGGKGEPYLRVVANNLNRLYRLEDDGQFELDYVSLGLGPSVRPELYVGRWDIQEIDVNGNELMVAGITEQPCGTQVCDAFPVDNVQPSSGGPNLGITPNYVGVGFEALIYNNFLYDYEFAGSTRSAAIVFTIYNNDSPPRPLCRVSYDASDYQIDNSWTTDNGEDLWAGWAVDLVAGRGQSNCGTIDSATFGTTDIRTVLERFAWGFGIGKMSRAFESELEVTFGPAQWKVLGPTLHSVYITSDRVNATEMSIGQNIDLQGCYTADPDLTPDATIPDGSNLPESLYLAEPVYVIDIQ